MNIKKDDTAKDFVRNIDAVVLLKDAIEISVWGKDDLVYVAVIHDGSGFSPAAALYVNTGSEQASLEECYDLLRTVQIDQLTPEDISSLEKDAQDLDMDWQELFTETYDGHVYTMTYETFMQSCAKIREFNKNQMIAKMNE